LLQDLKALPDNTVVLMQPCGHNPTGIDPTKEQWDEITKIFLERKNLFMFFDMA